MVAAGLGTLIAVRRRRQLARRLPGTEPPPIPEPAAAVIDAIADVDVDYTIGVDHTLRRLGLALGERASVPVPIIATVDGSSIDLLLDRRDHDPPEPWSSVAGPIWRAPVEARNDDPDAGPAWLPALVSIGALDAGGMLLNLEAVGAVGLVGEQPAMALARSIVAELAMTPLADVASVHVVGDVIGDIANLPRVRHHDNVAAALAAAIDDTAAISGALAGTGTPNAIELRCRARDEAWAPAVVVAPAASAAADDVARLLERCCERAGIVAVLVGACPPGALEVYVTADEVTIPALDLSCMPQQLERETLDAIEEVLDSSDEPCVEPADDSQLTFFTPAELGEDDARTDGPRLHLYLLGQIRLEGADISPQQLALVAYLALHPDATADAVRDAIWGGRPPTRERFLNTMHELRRVLGPDVVPTSTDGRYRLRRTWCDLAEVERLIAEAKANPGDRAVPLRAVLELVAGPPLTFESRHRRHFTWIDLGNYASRWERIVGDAAHDLAQLALDQGDVDLAHWAAERGLQASPASQILTCDLISAHLAAGDRNAAEHVVDAYGRVLEDMGCDETPEAVQELLESRRAS
jgi:DNA-binding SARP family transcriptional activator